MWAREPKEADGTRPGEQESPRWIDGDQRVAELAEQLPQTGLVYVGDRESDMLELMVQARDSGVSGRLSAARPAQSCLTGVGGKRWGRGARERGALVN